MPKIRGGKSSLNTRKTDVPNPRKSKNATKDLYSKLDQIWNFQKREAQKIKNTFNDNNDSNSNDDDYYEDDENYNNYNVDNDDGDYEDNNKDDVDNVDYEEDKNYSDDNNDVNTANNELNKKVLIPESPHVRKHNVNQQHMAAAPIWAIQLHTEIRSLTKRFDEFLNSFNEWKTMIQPLLDVNLLTSGDVPKVIPFQYVEDLVNFERATEAEKIELVQFCKGFCTNNAQTSCNEIFINCIGSHEYISPYVTTEGKGSLHPPSLPPMIKTKFGECVKSTLSLRSNRFPKPPLTDFKSIFNESLKVIKNRRRRLEEAGKISPIKKDDTNIEPKKRPAAATTNNI